jgi:hypothetical protein
MTQYKHSSLFPAKRQWQMKMFSNLVVHQLEVEEPRQVQNDRRHDHLSPTYKTFYKYSQ